MKVTTLSSPCHFVKWFFNYEDSIPLHSIPRVWRECIAWRIPQGLVPLAHDCAKSCVPGFNEITFALQSGSPHPFHWLIHSSIKLICVASRRIFTRTVENIRIVLLHCLCIVFAIFHQRSIWRSCLKDATSTYLFTPIYVGVLTFGVRNVPWMQS